MSDTKQPNVSTGNVFSFNNGAFVPIAGTGTFQTNVEIATGAAPRSRVGTTEILSDGPSAAVAGVETGAESATKLFPNLPGAAGRIAPGAAWVGGINDTINVWQHLLQGNGAEAVTETLGVGGQTGGAWIGAETLGAIGSSLGPYGTVAGTFIGGMAGAFGGAQYAKELGTYLTGGDTPDKLGLPLTLPNDTPLQPTVTTADGHQYALVQVDGKYTWFAMSNDGGMTPNLYTEVVRGSVIAELTQSYLGAAGFEQQVATYNAQVAAYNSQVAQDGFIQSEITQQNTTAPDGQPYGTTTQTAPNASQTWSQTSQPGLSTRTQDVRNPDGSITRIVTDVDTATGATLGERVYQNTHSANNPNAPDSFNLVSTFDAATGQRQSINRDTGLMEPVQGNPSNTPNPSSYYNPTTALPNAPTASGENSTPNYVIQPGDTVSGIANKLGLTPAQYSDYLKSVYGPNADLNSIVAGRELPVPANAPHAGSRPSSGDAPLTAAPSADNDYQPGAGNGEAEAAAYLAQQSSNTGSNTSTNTNTPPSDAGSGTSANSADSTTDAVSEQNQPEAPATSAPAAPETIANTSPPFVQHGSEYNPILQPYLSALNLVQGLDGLQHWDKMGDLGRFNTTLGLANNINNLREGSLGNLGTLNQLSSYVNLAQNIENGNLLGTLSSINAIGGNHAIDAALNGALGSSGVPYLGIAIALNDFEHHPGQSTGALVGMIWGPAGSAIGGMVGGLLDGAGLFGDNRPPPPEGASSSDIRQVTTYDAKGQQVGTVLDAVQDHTDALQATAQSIATTHILKNTDSDDYIEKTQWVSATDEKEAANNSSWRCSA